MDAELIAFVRTTFGWRDEVAVTPGPRGALGQIWRVQVGPYRHALKEIFAEPPTGAQIDDELTLVRAAVGAGLSVPASHPDRDGQYLVEAPDGTRLRLYDWADLRPVEAPSPVELGELIARLHRCAPASPTEPGCSPPDRWYDTIPADEAWIDVAGWDARVAAVVARLGELRALVMPGDPARLLLCHRDLHPGNVLHGPSGRLAVIDWDNVGPADPSRELARALFDWFSDPVVDLDAMVSLYAAYRRAGGPGRITALADFTMLTASRLNFLLVQSRVAMNPSAPPGQRAWAEQEVAETSRLTPTAAQLAAVLDGIRGIA